LEPSMPLAEVTESVVNAFARGVRDAGVPVFVRFASEFNDPANQWSRDPALYVQKFRLMADALHRIAPKAAAVWMPMASRLEVIDRYYPGAAYVDWAGLSVYSTPFSNGDAAQSNLRVSPLDAIAEFYNKYAPVHPIQISEYASSSETGLKPGMDFSGFAAQKMRMLYWGAMLRFPRLKNINWLDVDMLRSRFVVPSDSAERRNNYALFSNSAKLETFKSLLFEPYFLRDIEASSSATPSPLTALPANTRNLEIAAWVKTYDPTIARVVYSVSKRAFASSDTLPYRVTLPPLPAGTRTLTLTAYDASGQVLLTRSQRLTVR
jgi:Glycosyl hydrolase family 26